MLRLPVRRGIQSAIRVGSKVTGVGLVGSVGYGFYLYETDEGYERAFRAYGTMVPVVLNYRYVEAKGKLLKFLNHHQQQFTSSGDSTSEQQQQQQKMIEDHMEEEWKALDEYYAKRTVEALGNLNGIYTKYCQTAAGFHNTFSEIWIEEFRKLENDVPNPRSIETIRQTILEETGKPLEEIFEKFDPIPLGSASIGQVHKAVLKDSLQTVAVKIQYHDAEQIFQEDVETIRNFCITFAPEHVVTLSALEKQNALEMDYQLEAKNLRDVATNMKQHNLMPREVVVPQPIVKLSTRRMLVMEYMEGIKLNDGVRAYFAEWAQKNGTTLEQLEMEARRKIDQEGIPEKYNGPSAFQISIARHALQAYNAIMGSIVIPMWNGTIGGGANFQPKMIPPNIPRCLDTLMRVHGYQMLADGVFQADPHGGNFLLLKDGRIGLIDYGATKRLTKNERLTCCLLFAAIYRGDEDKLFTMSQIGGYKSKYGRKDVLMKLIQFGYDSWGHDVTGGKNLQQFIDELKETDPWEEVPDNFVMAQFMSIRLRSLALGMNHPVKCSQWWGPIAEEILRKEGLPYETWDYEQMVKYKPELNIQKHKFA